MRNWLQQLVNLLVRFLQAIFGETQQPTTSSDPCAEPVSLTVPPEYRKTKSLMTYQERKFYRLVLKELSSEYAIFSKVRLADIVWLANEPTDKKYHSNQIQCKHIDFILCDKQTLEPVLALELDDSSHSQYDRQLSDEVKDRVCAQAGLPLFRVKVEYSYSVKTIQEDIQSKIRAHSVNLVKNM